MTVPTTTTTEPKPWVMKILSRTVCKLCGEVKNGSLWLFYRERIDQMEDYMFCQECIAEVLIDALVVKTVGNASQRDE